MFLKNALEGSNTLNFREFTHLISQNLIFTKQVHTHIYLPFETYCKNKIP